MYASAVFDRKKKKLEAAAQSLHWNSNPGTAEITDALQLQKSGRRAPGGSDGETDMQCVLWTSSKNTASVQDD